MRIKYLGPSPSVNVGEFVHLKDRVETYPAAVGKELLETSKKQKFEEVLEKDSPRPNAQDSIKKIQAASFDELEQLTVGEERKTVLEAIAKRREELTTPGDKV